MPAFYIITQDGFLKKYYSGQDLTSTVVENIKPVFSDFLRKAITYKSFSEANEIIVEKNLVNCFVINQYGELQNQ
ncbi:MAG: hypothetical protein CVV60_00450 [Tenericutes bacterium HGW-Tenericutes-5]|jgi:hypothetical protein|nr:MAG: hypothetical protein CVV60_00450 [Tenericutes bacterium HGW-Tenericutes-5]